MDSDQTKQGDPSKLNDRQRQFVREYLIDFNATQAAIRAGYSPKAATAVASRLLTNANVSAAIEEGRQRLAEKTDITAERVLAELAKIAFLDVRKAFNADGSLKPIDELDDNTAAAIAGLEVAAINEDGATIGSLKKIKLADKISALEKLGRNLNLFNTVTIKGDADNPLTLVLKGMQGAAFKPVKTPIDEDEA